MNGPGRETGGEPAGRSLAPKVALLLGVWALPAAVLTILTYGIGPAYGVDPPRSLAEELLTVQLPLWGGWAAATPFIFRLSTRFHPGGGAPVRPILVHVGAVLLLWLTHTFVLAVAQWGTGSLGEEMDLLSVYRRLLPQFAILEFVIYPAVAATGFGIHMTRVSRRSERRASALESQLSEARLEALRVQLQPHFLFNALNTVVMQIRRGAHREALRLLLGFADLLREILDLQRGMIPLEEEVDLARRYLAIERARFGDRLSVEIEEDAAAAAALVPALLLQPLVENALRHGVDRREGPVTVRLSTERRGARVLVRLRNDGPPLQEGGSPGGDGGTGLRLTRARIREGYEDAASVDIRSAEGGVVVSLDLPYVAAPEAVAVGIA